MTVSPNHDVRGNVPWDEAKVAGLTFDDQRQAIERRLSSGASGFEVVSALTELVDGVIVDRYRAAVRSFDESTAARGLQHCCVVALGGYGRRELAPYSDIDLMFLFRPQGKEIMSELSRRMLHHLWDLGFQVGHSVRTISDCLELPGHDLAVKTSLLEARFLAGGPRLFDDFQHRYARRVIARGVDRFIAQKMEERRREYEKFGETIYLLEPNVKKSKGGLRDLHTLQWAGMVRYGSGTIQDLAGRGILSRADYLAIADARDFLWRVRALLHFHAGSAQEILSFDEQIWLAERFGFEDRPHLLAVEQFMQQYYRHTMGLNERCARFVDRCRRVSLMDRMAQLWPAPPLDGHFVVSRRSLTVPADSRGRVLNNPPLLLRLFELAQSRRLSIDTDLLEEIHQCVETVPQQAFQTPETSRIFLKILAGPGAVAGTLEALHRARLLEKLIPVFAAVRGLMQFNQYHKYTVDEHSLLAVAKAEALGQESGVLGDVYREIRRKDILHLAVLLHDLGKGQELDHSEIGKAIAEETAAWLGFDEQESRTLVFLVHRHLLMAHTAFRRDPYDDKVLLPFARAVATPEVLRKLLALTAADIAAVGPGVFTKWKESLLVELYLRTLPEVSGERGTVDDAQHVERIAGEVACQPALTGTRMSESWVVSQLRQFPARYVHSTPTRRMAAHLAAVRSLQPGHVLVKDHFSESLGACEYTIVTSNALTPGIFSKIAGVMAAKGLQILDAQIITRADGVIVDTFQAVDVDYSGSPPNERRADIGQTIVRVLNGQETVEHLLERNQRLCTVRRLPNNRQPPEVQIDNETSDRFTIIDVFADDRQGLLYVITRAIFMLELSVHAARISTRLDQVADVFYVAEQDGSKVEDHGRLELIRTTIKGNIEGFLKTQAESENQTSFVTL